MSDSHPDAEQPASSAEPNGDSEVDSGTTPPLPDGGPRDGSYEQSKNDPDDDAAPAGADDAGEGEREDEPAGMAPGQGPGLGKRAEKVDGALSPGTTADGSPTSR
ncbi:hypothetical protein GCM10027416_27530 [Okibacterium endophyticum]